MWGTIVTTLLLTLLLTIAWRFFNWVWLRPKSMERMLRRQGLKGNPYRFLFGDAKETAIMYDESYSKPIAIEDDIVARVMPFISKTLKTYGENSFMWVGPRPLVFITELDLMKFVINRHNSFQKPFRITNPIFKRLMGGLVGFEGEKWSKSRKTLNPLFSVEKLREMIPIMHQHTEDILNEWKTMIPKDGTTSGLVDVYPYLPEFSGSVLSLTFFSIPYEGKIRRTFHLISELTLLANQAQPFSIPGEQYLPTKKNKRAWEIENELHVTYTNMINERIKKRAACETQDREPDLFDRLLDELQEQKITNSRDRAMVLHDIIQQCKIFFLGGSETTSNLIAWTLVMLSVHQDWQARAREEAFQVFGDKTELDNDEISELKIITMIINEMLRLYPPIIELSRVVEEEEIQVGNYRLQKGTMIMMPLIMLHRNKKIWGEDALEFKPERFEEGVLKAANGHAGAFMPFGWGVRTCIGYNLALREAKIFIALVLKNFYFELSPTYVHAPLVSLNLMPQHGLPLMLRKV